MKKLFTLTLAIITIFAFTTVASATNAVSQMATTEGGQHIAKCAQMMDQGVSKCAKMSVCNMIMCD